MGCSNIKMSDENKDNTNVTEPEPELEEVIVTKKDPKRVEQGKRLAMISKEAKEKKMRSYRERKL